MILANRRESSYRDRVADSSSFLLEQLLHERVRVERLHVVDLLADADELHRQAELLLDGEDRAALGGAVELREHDAGALHRLRELLGLRRSRSGRSSRRAPAAPRAARRGSASRPRGESSPAPASGASACAAGRRCPRSARRSRGPSPSRRRRGPRRRVAPCPCLTISQPIRPAQIVSCSTAAARKVSHAATSTFLPSVCSRLASLAIEVVLPEPLTPAIITTVGPVAA